jgi:hypothetical protein
MLFSRLLLFCLFFLAGMLFYVGDARVDILKLCCDWRHHRKPSWIDVQQDATPKDKNHKHKLHVYRLRPNFERLRCELNLAPVWKGLWAVTAESASSLWLQGNDTKWSSPLIHHGQSGVKQSCIKSCPSWSSVCDSEVTYSNSTPPPGSCGLHRCCSQVHVYKRFLTTCPLELIVTYTECIVQWNLYKAELE